MGDAQAGHARLMQASGLHRDPRDPRIDDVPAAVSGDRA